MQTKSELYPMQNKHYYIIYKGMSIAYGICTYDNVKYILFTFLGIKKGSIFHQSFSVDQSIRFRRPFEGFIFHFNPEDQKPYKKSELKFFEISSSIKAKFYVNKKTKKA